MYRLSCDEAADEPKGISSEQVLKIECNISITTNFMLTGIMSASNNAIYCILITYLDQNSLWTLK